MICLVRLGIEVDRKSFLGIADNDGIHRGLNWTATEFFGDSVGFKNLPLPLRSSSSVAAHRRNDKRARAKVQKVVDDRLDNHINIGDSATSGRDRNALACMNLLLKRQSLQLRIDFQRHVVDSWTVR